MRRRRNHLDWDERIVLRDLRRDWPVRRVLLLVSAWYWRYELAALTAVSLVMWGLVSQLGAPLAATLVLVLGVAVGLVPKARDVVVRAGWHVITPHRVRRGLVEAGVYSRKGRIPEVLRVRSVPAGELVTLWCFAGTSFEEIVAGAQLIGTACYAKELRVSRDDRYSHLVRILVVRRGGSSSNVARPDKPASPNPGPTSSDGPSEIFRPNAAVQKGLPATRTEESAEMPTQRHGRGHSLSGGER
jgi:hypothetical protein